MDAPWSNVSWLAMKIFQTKDKQTHSLEQTDRKLDFRPDIPQSLQLYPVSDMRKQEEFGLILCKTVQNQPRLWFYPKMNLSTVDTRSRNSVSSYAKLAVKLHFNCPKGRRKVIARRVILMVKHFFFKKHLLSHVKRYIKSTQIFTSYRWTNGVENENNQEYFCFEEKQDKISIIAWLRFEVPVAQRTSMLDF